MSNINYKQAATIAAEIQYLTQRWAKYFETSVPFLVEAGVNGTGTVPATPEGVIAPFKTFMTSIETLAEAAKAAEGSYTVAKGFNTINDYTADKYANEITQIGLRAKNRKAALTTPTGKQLQHIAGAMHEDVLSMLFCPKGGMFNALLWYVEALLLTDEAGTKLVTDVATWIAPLETLYTETQAQLAKWQEDKVKGKVSDKNIETITPFTIEVIERATANIKGKATKVLELTAPAVDPVDPPEGAPVVQEQGRKFKKQQAAAQVVETPVVPTVETPVATKVETPKTLEESLTNF